MDRRFDSSEVHRFIRTVLGVHAEEDQFRLGQRLHRIGVEGEQPPRLSAVQQFLDAGFHERRLPCLKERDPPLIDVEGPDSMADGGEA